MVDTENVSSSWHMMLADMTKNDVLYLFYTENSPVIGYSDFKEIMESEVQPEMISCHTGKNGLDFQLVSYMGFLIKSAPKSEYIIISNDNGFDSVIHFWKDQGYKVSRMTVYNLVQMKKARIAKEREMHRQQLILAKPEGSHEKPGEANQKNSAVTDSVINDNGTNDIKIVETKENTINNAKKIIVISEKKDKGNVASIKKEVLNVVSDSTKEAAANVAAALEKTAVENEEVIEEKAAPKQIMLHMPLKEQSAVTKEENIQLPVSETLSEITTQEKPVQKRRGRKKKNVSQEAVNAEAAEIQNMQVDIQSVTGDYAVTEIQNTQNVQSVQNDTSNDDSENGKQLLSDLLAAYDEIDEDTVIEILKQNSSHHLQKVYAQMLKLFGHQAGVELYHVLKPHFSVLFTYAKKCV